MSKMEANTKQSNQSQPEAIYRAVGWVAASYQPSAENIANGVFVTSDGLNVPARMTGRLRRHLEKKHSEYMTQPDLFQQLQRWTVYPKTEPLRFELVMMKPLSNQPEQGDSLNQFIVIGKIRSCSDGTIAIRIQHNQPYQQGKKFNKPHSFVLTLEGSLPVEAVKQVWELKVRRIAEKLVVMTGQVYQASEADKAMLLQNRKKAVAMAAKEAAKQPEIDAKESVDRVQLDTASVKVDRSEAGVPQIADKKQSAIAPPPELTVETSANNESTSAQAIPSTQQQQQNQQLAPEPEAATTSDATTAKHSSSKSKSSSQASAPAAMMRPPNQQKTSAPTNQPSAAQSPHLPVLKPQQVRSKEKQAQVAPAKTKTNQGKPAFQVRVNDQVFSGYSSVTLTNRMLHIDGRAVAQAKMAIVIGQPERIQADRVPQGENQVVLMSK